MRRVRDAEIRAAQRAGDERRVRAARTLPTRMTRAEGESLALRRERLLNQPEEPYDDFIGGMWDEGIDSWALWRADFESRGGS